VRFGGEGRVQRISTTEKKSSALYAYSCCIELAIQHQWTIKKYEKVPLKSSAMHNANRLCIVPFMYLMPHVEDKAKNDEDEENDDKDDDDGDGLVPAELLQTVEGEEDLVVPAVGGHVVQVPQLTSPLPHVLKEVLNHTRTHNFCTKDVSKKSFGFQF